MTPQEALKIRKNLHFEDVDNEELSRCIDEALEKQIAKKPADYDGKIKVGFCPDCESVVTSDFCDNCGQALDWSDDK